MHTYARPRWAIRWSTHVQGAQLLWKRNDLSCFLCRITLQPSRYNTAYHGCYIFIVVRAPSHVLFIMEPVRPGLEKVLRLLWSKKASAQRRSAPVELSSGSGIPFACCNINSTYFLPMISDCQSRLACIC